MEKGMLKIEILDNSSVETSLFIERINNLSDKIEALNTNYYIDSRILQEAYLLLLDVILKSLANAFNDEERHHFQKYFLIEKSKLIEKLLEKIPKF